MIVMKVECGMWNLVTFATKVRLLLAPGVQGVSHPVGFCQVLALASRFLAGWALLTVQTLRLPRCTFLCFSFTKTQTCALHHSSRMG